MNILKNYSLSIVLFLLFLLSWIGHGIFLYQQELDEAKIHNEELKTQDYVDTFFSTTFENWQSEFLQLFTMVVLTSFLIHKGSSESKDSDEEMQKKLNKMEKMIKELREK
jgi:hypothetical protein